MATRLNLPHPTGAGAPTVSPAYDADWEWTDFAVRARIGPRRYNTPRTVVVGPHEDTSSGNQDVLGVQYVSEPLAEQTISGTARAIIPARESSAAANARAQMCIRVFSGDGTTERGTLLAHDTAALSNELTVTGPPYPNVMYPVGHNNTTFSPVDAQEGDRLVIEIGVRAHNTSATNFTFVWQLSDDADLADCAEDESGTTGRGWIEFSQDLVWAPTYTVSSTTISAGDLAAAILAARTAGHDVLYLEAGTYTYGSVTNDTAGTKMLHVRPAAGVDRDDVVISDGFRPLTVGLRYLSFEDLCLRQGIQLEQSYMVQFVGCKLTGIQLEARCARTLIENCELGGVFGFALNGYAILASVDAGESGLADLRILGCHFSNCLDNTYVRIGKFDNAIVDRNTIETAVRDERAAQEVIVTGTGTFTLTYAGQTTTALAHNASAATVQTALRALSTIGSAGVSCSGTLAAGMACTFVTDLQSASSSVAYPTELLVENESGITGGVVTVSYESAHTDGFRVFEGGMKLTFTNNYIVGGEYQGFFIGGGTVHDILFANNIVGPCSGSFRGMALGDNTTRFRIINNLFTDGGSFSGSGVVHTQAVMFNNACSPGGSIGRVTAGINWAYHDYNVWDGDPSVGGIDEGANDILTAVTCVDLAGADYRLTAGSSGVNFGIESAVGWFAPTTDINGNPRSFPCEAGAIEGVI